MRGLTAKSRIIVVKMSFKCVKIATEHMPDASSHVAQWKWNRDGGDTEHDWMEEIKFNRLIWYTPFGASFDVSASILRCFSIYLEMISNLHFRDGNNGTRESDKVIVDHSSFDHCNTTAQISSLCAFHLRFTYVNDSHEFPIFTDVLSRNDLFVYFSFLVLRSSVI